VSNEKNNEKSAQDKDDLQTYFKEMETLEEDFSDLDDLDMEEIQEMREAIELVKEEEKTDEETIQEAPSQETLDEQDDLEISEDTSQFEYNQADEQELIEKYKQHKGIDFDIEKLDDSISDETLNLEDDVDKSESVESVEEASEMENLELTSNQEELLTDFSDLGKMDLNELLEMKKAVETVKKEKPGLVPEGSTEAEGSESMEDELERRLQEELDANKEGTAFYELKDCIEEGFEEVKIAVAASYARDKEREKGTAKGRDFQEFVYERLDEMARDFEDTVEFVGDETGSLSKVGDVVVHINTNVTKGIEQRIVFEAKKASISMSGKSSFLKELDEARDNRNSHYAIGAVHESCTPDSIGKYRRYDGSKIICSVPDDEYPLALEIAYKVARGELIFSLHKKELEIDPSRIIEKIDEIESQLGYMRSIKSSLTGAKKKINGATNYTLTIIVFK